MNRYKRYPKYKDSGVEWIGEVPEHWSVLRLANIGPLMKANGGNRQDDAESGIPCIRYGDLYTTYDFLIRDIKKFISNESVPNYTPIQHGDILFAASGETFEEIGKSAVNLEECCAYCGGDIIVLRPQRPIDSVFLGYAAGSSSAQAQKSMMGKGFTVIHLYGDQLRNLVIAMPPEPEQKLIGDMIETETARMDALIAKKTRFIEVLNEKRAALITHAVRAGLNPNVKMKDSGVAWLGQVPEHWEILRAKRLFCERDERSTTGHEELLTVSHLTGVTPRAEKDVNMFEAETTEGYKICYAGDLVINTMWAWMGAMGTSRQTGLVSPSYNVYAPTDLIDPEFVDLLVRMPIFATEVKRFSKGIWSSRLRLYPEAFFEVEFPIPPRIEQQTIVAKVRVETNRINALIEKTLRSIDLLKERRSALITAAVTGQIDVRRSV